MGAIMVQGSKLCSKQGICDKKAGFFSLNKILIAIIIILAVLTTIPFTEATVQDAFNRTNQNLIGSTATNGNNWIYMLAAGGDHVEIQVAQNNLLVNTSGNSVADGNREFAFNTTGSTTPSRVDLWNISIESVSDLRLYLKFRVDSTGTDFTRLRIHTSGGSVLQYYDGAAWTNTGFSPSDDVPFHISLRDIDFTAHTFDIYVNDTSYIDDGPFYNDVAGFSTMQVMYQLSSGADRGDLEIFCMTTDQATAAGCFAGGGVPPGPVASNVTFQASSNLNTTLTYNVTFGNGSEYYEYNNKQGTITTPILDNDTSLWTFNTTADYHFNRTLHNRDVTGGSISTTLVRNPVLNASNQYNNSPINAFNATINGVTYHPTDGKIYIPYNESISVRSQAEKHFVNETIINFTGPTNRTVNLYPWTVITAYFANATPIQVINFTINVSINGSEKTYYVTNSTLELPFYNELINMTIFNASVIGIPLEQQEAYINSTGAYTRGYTFYLYTANSFFFTIRNETTNELITSPATIQLIGPLSSQQYNATGGTLNLTLLTPQEYTIKYWIDANIPREYYITLINGSVENITLYTIDDAFSDLYYPTVTDENGQACSAMTVSLLRYYIDINGYRVVEMAKTDTNGQAVLFVQPQITNYKLLFNGDCGTFTTEPQKITDATDRFTVSSAQALLTSSEAINGADIAFTFNNATNTYNFVWSDSTNTVSEACLYVYKHVYFTETLNYTACTSAAAGSLIYTLTGNLTDTTWSAQAVLHTDTPYSDYNFRGPDIDFSGAGGIGLAALLWLGITILAFVVAFGTDATTVIVSSIGLTAIFITLGLVAGGTSVVIGLLIVGVIMLYKLRRGP